MNRSARRLVRWLTSAAIVALAVSVPSYGALADLRVQNHRFSHICRLIAFVDSHRGTSVIYDGPVRRGEHRTFSSPGSILCIQRSFVAERCNSGLTRPVCKLDRHSNRTVLWTIQ